MFYPISPSPNNDNHKKIPFRKSEEILKINFNKTLIIPWNFCYCIYVMTSISF